MNVVILAEVTAQYFFYKEYFMYLLYILCIGLHSYVIVTGILLKRVYVCNSTDLFAILEQTWKKHRLPPARLNPTNARM